MKETQNRRRGTVCLLFPGDGQPAEGVPFFLPGGVGAARGQRADPGGLHLPPPWRNLPMTPSTFTWRFKLILKKHNLPLDLNVHSLRHTAASLMISGGADVATVSGLLGHSQVSTTLDIYTHAFDEKKREVSARCRGGWGCETRSFCCLGFS